MINKGQLLSAQNLNNAYISKTNTSDQAIASNLIVSGGALTLKNSVITDNANSGYLRIDPQGNQVIIYDGVNNQSLNVYGSSGSDSISMTTITGSPSHSLIDVSTNVDHLEINTGTGKSITLGGATTVYNNSLTFDGTPTTTNKATGVFWTAFDKEATTDYSDTAHIIHTVNTGGLSGSVLEISSQNDTTDGVNFVTNGNSNVRINGNIIWNQGNDGSGSGLDADLLDNMQPSSSNTVSTVVSRDGSGNFSAGTINASLNGVATWATYQQSTDGDRLASTKLPTTSPNAVRFDFIHSSEVTGAGGSYAGLMTYAPWLGTTTSTGDASYQLAFNSTATNGSGIPNLFLRNGIDSTWNTWYKIWHSGNQGSGSGLDADKLDGLDSSSFATSAQGTKADNALPSSSYTASDVLAKIKTVDGSGSGLDADTLDNIDSTGFALSDGTTANATSKDLNTLTTSGFYRLGNTPVNAPSTASYGQLIVAHGGSDTILQIVGSYSSSELYFRGGNPSNVGGSGTYKAWARIWNDQNDGSGSGLDADLLDGLDSSSFATSAQGTKADNALPSSSYTASDVLAKIKTVDGSGSGLDADMVDGLHSSSFATSAQGTKADNALPSSSYTASDVLTKIKTVDGSGSGLDADMVDGLHSSSLLRSDTSDTMNGTLTITGPIIAENSGESHFSNGTYSDPQSGSSRAIKAMGGIATDYLWSSGNISLGGTYYLNGVQHIQMAYVTIPNNGSGGYKWTFTAIPSTSGCQPFVTLNIVPGTQYFVNAGNNSRSSCTYYHSSSGSLSGWIFEMQQ